MWTGRSNKLTEARCWVVARYVQNLGLSNLWRSSQDDLLLFSAERLTDAARSDVVRTDCGDIRKILIWENARPSDRIGIGNCTAPSKMMNTSIRSIACALCVGLLVLETVGCATSPINVEGAWESPRTRTEPFDAVLVVAIAPNARARRAFEVTLVNAVASSGEATAVASHTLFPQSTSQLTREIVVNMARTTAADAVLVTRILDQTVADGQSQGEVVQRRGPSVTISHNEDWSMTTVISTNYSTEFQEGYRVYKVDNVLDTLVYEPKAGERLVYRATTWGHFDIGPENSIEKGAAVFARAIAARLREDGVIR